MAVDIDEVKVKRNALGLWLGWTLATTAGMLLGFLPFALLIENIELLAVRLLMPLWAGFLVGLFQWLVVRRFLTHSVNWIVNGGVGWALGYALGLLAIQLLKDGVWGVLVGYVLFGLMIAVLQWPVLRREIPNVLPWAGANVLGWALGAYIGRFVSTGSDPERALPIVVSTAIIASLTGLVAGAVTGLALVWIVRQPEQDWVPKESRL
jgi:hypothetical protein